VKQPPAPRAPRAPLAVAPAWEATAHAQVDPAVDGEAPDYNVSRARSEFERANLLELQRKQQEGELGSIAEMRAATFNLAKAAREAVLAVPPRISAELAATTDPFQVEHLLEEELITAMRSIAAVEASSDA
jgi:hypothetical protein